jgi:hypothetical protein
MTALLDALGPIPKPLVTLDFESYWTTEYTLRKLTTESYVRDPRFEVIGVGVKVNSRPAVWMEEADFRAWAKGFPWSQVRVLMHHAQFDAFILSHHYGIIPGFILDTLSTARAVHGGIHGNGLDVLAEKYGVGVKGRELLKTQGKRRRDFTPEEWLEFGRYCCNDVELTYGLGAKMFPGFPLEELWLIDTTVRMFTEPRFVADQAVLTEALENEREVKRRVLGRVAATAGRHVPEGATEDQALEGARAVLSSNPKFAELLTSMGEVPPEKRNKKDELTYAFAKSDPGMQALLEHENSEIRAVAEARLKVKSTIVETRVQRFLGCARRGAMTVYLKYCGAHTHRWSGGDKSNWQNLDRVDPRKPDSGMLRRSINAPTTHVLSVADSSQIEARVVTWVAGDESKLAMFVELDEQTNRYRAAFAEREHALGHKDEKRINRELAALGIEEGDLYATAGTRYFGRKITKQETPVERQVAKSMELGLGFGLGWYTFASSLLKGFLDAPPVQFTVEHAEKFGVGVADFEARPHGRDGPLCGERVRDMMTFGARLPYGPLLIHCAVTDHFVRLYRKTNKKIADLWNDMGRVLDIMAAPGDDTGVRCKFGVLEVLKNGLRKPNGLTLHYHKLHRAGDGYKYWGLKEGRMQWCKIYGGLLTENVVQSLARDIVAEQALWIRAAGYRIGTTTHDEVVAIVPEERGQECLAYMLQRMRTPPAWCLDLPLNASGGTAKSYGAVK